LVNDSALQKNIEQMTDAELVVLASGCGVLREMNDADLAAKGKSGNPGGRPRALASVMHEARRHTLEALRVLLKLMRSDSALQKNIEQMTDAELVVLASRCGVLREMNDADLAALWRTHP
jgi:uncharacterized cysteine cluster protein YcgN (CxxCxxCC family)